ncbi:MAG: hypothetical protein MUO76_01010 [Anaerolineaceae bacterium]|nr:hypothetical protein [Anaerolineaceae bacterium]
MSENISLKKLEKRAFKTYHDDGTWEAGVGLFMVYMALYERLFGTVEPEAIRYLLLGFGVSLLLYAPFWALKKYFVTPRLGRVEFSETRKKRSKKAIVIVVIAVTLTFIPLIATILIKNSLVDWEGYRYPHAAIEIGAGIFIALVMTLIAYFQDFDRLYVYGVLMGMTMTTTWIIEDTYPFAIAGGIIFATGTFFFISFFRKYGRSVDEVADDHI